MRSRATVLVAAALALAFVLVSSGQSGRKHQPVIMTRLYTGSDGLTHADQVEAKFTAGSANEIYKLLAVTGAELHRAAPGTVIDWHTAPRRQYVITLSGHGEIEVAGGKKFEVAREPLIWSRTQPGRGTSRE